MKQNETEAHLSVVTAGMEDAKGMAQLNDAIYPKEWHVAPEYLREIMQKNDEVYRIIKTPRGVKGIYGLFPLSAGDYEAVLAGKLEESEVANHLLPNERAKAVYLYLITLIVDIHDTVRKQYASKLIKDIPLQLKRLEEKGIEIIEVGAYAVSPDGEKVLPKMGFTHRGEKAVLNKEYPVYRATPAQIFAHIKSSYIKQE